MLDYLKKEKEKAISRSEVKAPLTRCCASVNLSHGAPQLVWAIIYRYCLASVWRWAIVIDSVFFFFLLPWLSFLHRSQLSSLPQHTKLVCTVAKCVYHTHAAFCSSLSYSLTHSLPIPFFPRLTDITSPRACSSSKDASVSLLELWTSHNTLVVWKQRDSIVWQIDEQVWPVALAAHTHAHKQMNTRADNIVCL